MSAAPDAARRVLVGTAAQLAGRGLSAVSGLVLLVVLTSALTPDDFGRFVAATSFLALMAGFTDWGVATLGVRRLSRDVSRAGEIFQATLLVQLVTGLVLMVVGAAVAAGLYLPTDRSEVFLAALLLLPILPLSAMTAAFRVLYEPSLRYATFAAVDAGARVVGTLVVLTAALLGAGLTTLVVLSNTAAGLLLLGCAVAFRRAAAPVPRRGSSPLPLAGALPIGATIVIAAVYVRIDVVILSALRPEAEVAAYGLAYRLLEILLAGGTIYMATVFPLLAALSGDRPAWARVADRSLQLVLCLGLPIALCGFFAAPDLVRLLGDGEAYDAAVTPLRVLLLVVVVSYVNNWAVTLLISIGHQSRAIRVYSSGLLLNVVGNLVLIPRYGGTGAAAATLGSEILVAALLLLALHRLARYRPRPPRTVAVLVVNALTVVVAALLLSVVDATLVVTAVVALAYAGTLWAARVVPLPGRSRAADVDPPLPSRPEVVETEQAPPRRTSRGPRP